jgi:hypothetical protein
MRRRRDITCRSSVGGLAGAVVGAIQRATGRVAAGEADPIDAAKRYAEDLAQTLGAERVVTPV